MQLKNISKDNPSNESIYSFQGSLNGILNDFKKIGQKTTNAAYAYQMAQKSIDEDNYPIIKVIEKASLKSNSKIIQFVFFGAVGSAVAMCFYIAILFFYHLYFKELSIIFAK